MHIYPSKWYLPYEPHIYVPLVNFMWPRCPRLWLAFWAIIGVRNKFQRELTWRQTVDANMQFCNTGLHYMPHSFYAALSKEVFGNCDWPMGYFLSKGGHGFMHKLHSALPTKGIIEFICMNTRYALLVNRKV